MSDRKDLIQTLKHNYRASRNYNMFAPGFVIGAFAAIRAKVYLHEPTFARPWVTIFSGLLVGSIMHYWVYTC